MKRIYIAHPYSGDGSPEWGYRGVNLYKYYLICEEAVRMGHAVLAWSHHHYISDNVNAGPDPFDFWLQRCEALIDVADEVWFCGPLEVSRGMQRELAYARKLGKRCLFLESRTETGALVLVEREDAKSMLG
jgi:hypothetical protein